MASLLSQLFSSTTCCPQGAVPQNGVCYCTKEQAIANPHGCAVVCQSLNYTLPPANGGCECPSGFVGELCRQRPCHVYDSATDTLRFYCLDNLGSESSEVTPNVVTDCTHLVNLVGSDLNITSLVYSPCPCFHGGEKMTELGPPGFHSCLCHEPFIGDLCHIEPYDASASDSTDPVTANTFLGIIAFAILAVTFLICFGRWFKKRRQRRRQMQSDFHRHYISQSEYHRGSRRTAEFLTSYVPILPIFMGQNNGGGNQNQNGKKQGGSQKETVPLKKTDSKGSMGKGSKKGNVLVCDDMHDVIKKGKT